MDWMLLERCPLEIAKDDRERQPLAASRFPCCAYSGDVRDYIAGAMPAHWHREWELLLLESGAATVTLPNLEFVLQPGQGCFVNAEKLHRIACAAAGPCRYRSLVFSPGILSGEAGSVFDVRYIRPLLEHGPPALWLRREERWQQPVFAGFEEAFSACAREPAGYEFAVRHALSQAALCIRAHSAQSKAARPDSLQEERLKQMIGWLDSQYEQPVTLRGLAGAVHLSARECERIFAQLLHSAPMAYLLHRRVAAASALLADTSLPVVEIGLRCGFSSHSYFSKQFRALTGYTPREYRGRVREGTAPSAAQEKAEP